MGLTRAPPPPTRKKTALGTTSAVYRCAPLAVLRGVWRRNVGGRLVDVATIQRRAGARTGSRALAGGAECGGAAGARIVGPLQEEVVERRFLSRCEMNLQW